MDPTEFDEREVAIVLEAVRLLTERYGHKRIPSEKQIGEELQKIIKGRGELILPAEIRKLGQLMMGFFKKRIIRP